MPSAFATAGSRALRAGLAVCAAVLAVAATSPARAANVEAGVLTCKVGGGVGFVFGSTKDLDCVFEGINGGKDRYVGSIDKYGIDLGFTGASLIVCCWRPRPRSALVCWQATTAASPPRPPWAWVLAPTR